MSKICIAGMGGWGTALAILIANNGEEGALWGRSPEKTSLVSATRVNAEYLPDARIPDSVIVTNNAAEAVFGAEVVIFAVPSRAMRSTAKLFGEFLADGTIVASAAKGFEEGTLKRMTEVLAEELPQAAIACLSGPGHAEEVSKGLATAYVAASLDQAAAARLQDVLLSPVFRVYTNADLIGVELGGALKNVIALATGMSDGAGYGDNAKAALMTRGAAEIARLGIAMGARHETFAGLTGIGDLIVTCTSMFSRNRRAGIMIGQGATLNETLEAVHTTVEGVITARSALALAKQYNVEMPIVNIVNCVLFEGMSPKAAVDSLMTRDRKEESIVSYL